MMTMIAQLRPWWSRSNREQDAMGLQVCRTIDILQLHTCRLPNLCPYLPNFSEGPVRLCNVRSGDNRCQIAVQ